MKNVKRFLLCGVSLLLLGISPRGDTASEADTCCYANPGYSGTCAVTPGEGESCASILAYLNNPTGHGKTYCGGTKVRGGWKQVACEEETPSQIIARGSPVLAEPGRDARR